MYHKCVPMKTTLNVTSVLRSGLLTGGAGAAASGSQTFSTGLAGKQHSEQM